MGKEATCKLRYGGKTFTGKALLETSEILFRGHTRLKIPFGSILAVQVEDGELLVRSKEGIAKFELGAQAEEWCQRILHPKSLLEKLGIRPGNTVSLVGEFHDEFLADLKKHGVAVNLKNPGDDPSWILLAASSSKELQQVRSIAKSMMGAAALWVVYPKGQKSITEGHVRSAGLKAGLTDVKVASFSTSHTALKFVIPRSKR
jgi:hypothetical protein